MAGNCLKVSISVNVLNRYLFLPF